MPRYARMIIPEEKTCYHLISRTALDNFPFGDVEKDEFVKIIKKFSSIYFFSFDFGLEEFGKMSRKERLRRYRRYVYESGAINHPGKRQVKVIDEQVMRKERKRNFSISRLDRFRNKTRYFTDSGIIGTREFVYQNYRRFKDRFQSQNEKVPRPVAGLEGIFSLKRLSEAL